MTPVRIVAAGDAALVAEFDERIDVSVNAQVLALAGQLGLAAVPGVHDIVPTFRSVAVHFDPLATDVGDLAARIHAASASALELPADGRSVRLPPSPKLRRTAEALADAGQAHGIGSEDPVEIPVCYDAEFALDLGEVARAAGLSRDDAIAAHAGRDYRVFMIGFLPGFAYLGSVDARIAAPRRAEPRLAVPAGAVGIAGLQTGIYPQQSPGGWNIVGRTPLRMAWLDRPRPTRLKAGDMVRFRAIDRSEFDRIVAEEGPAA